MSIETRTLSQPADVAENFARDFQQLIQKTLANQPKVHVALSGGSTPRLLFELWANQYVDSVDWNRVHFYWGDERCVDPEDPQSNYGVANELFLSKVKINSTNIHRVRGENNPEEERVRYEDEIKTSMTSETEWPKFDLIILGMGGDGHTASIFPHQMELMNSKDVCGLATHPETGQQRITLTGQVLNYSHRVAFLITGSGKAEVLKQVIEKTGEFESYPASHIDATETMFYLDQAAAAKLS